MRQPDFYRNKNAWKLILFVFALLIGVGTLLYTESFLKDMRSQEERYVQIWAQALKGTSSGKVQGDISLYFTILEDNRTIPIILADGDGTVITFRNLDSTKINRPGYVESVLEDMKEQNEPIVIEFAPGRVNYMYYKESLLLQKLRIYPWVLLGVIAVFVGISYAAFSSARRTEQERIWSGMAKETAHQIGTPLSSLMGWIELLRAQDADESALQEMSKDILRLETITSRFSKIGSVPELKEVDIIDVVEDSLDYLRRRTSKKIDITFRAPDSPIIIPVNQQLFSWVVENLIRNAIDAIDGPGSIHVQLSEAGRSVKIDVEDTGKGLTRNQFRAIFRPGYTTKTRGWGLGLSLARRIIEDYHNGKIFVLKSAPQAGTTFRVLLPIDRK